MPDDAYSINDLSRLTGLNVRTIRYYLSQGLIPASGESGPGAHYGQGHLDRLRLIKRLQTQYLPNAEIRRRLAALTDVEVATLVAGPEEDAAGSEGGSALDYIRSVLGTAGERPTLQARTASASPPAAAVGVAAATPAPPAQEPASSAIASPHLAEAGPAYPRPTVLPDAKSSAEAPTPLGRQPSDPQPSSPQPERSQWERLALAENIELHIRRPLSRIEQRRVERLITIARQVLSEDQS